MHPSKLFLAAAVVGGAAWLASLNAPAAPAGSSAPAPSAGGAPATYVVDPVHSGVLFRVMHLNTAWVFGRFNEFSGTIRFDEENPSNSSVEIEVNAASVDTASRGRDDHLRGSDFFESKQFPKITFKSSKVEDLGKGRLKLTGELTLRGHSETISFEVEKTGEGRNRQGHALVGFLGEFQVDRMAHGVSYMPGGLGETVHVTVSLEAAHRGGQ